MITLGLRWRIGWGLSGKSGGWGVEGAFGLEEVWIFGGRGEGIHARPIDRYWMSVFEQKHEHEHPVFFLSPRRCYLEAINLLGAFKRICHAGKAGPYMMCSPFLIQ